MAKFLDNVGEILFAFGAEAAAYDFWLRAYRIRQRRGDLD